MKYLTVFNFLQNGNAIAFFESGGSDRLVYELYDLTDEEIAIIENNL
jgi:hypothetical protein